MLPARTRQQARRIRAARRMGRNRSGESGVGARCALLDAPAAEEPLCPSYVEAELSDWCRWAVQAKVRPESYCFPSIQASTPSRRRCDVRSEHNYLARLL
jgi:hypothetical protein